MLHNDMEMPPYWIGFQVAIADSDGLIPDHERDVYTHFCKQECLIEFVNSTEVNEINERILLVDGESDPDDVPPDKIGDED